ncbi:MAG: DUF6438 domain-containing protein [Candidatus Kapabacteria bacterium]|nr:DUF6438 domain-containing protein [Candidatus Kapabacteria bacterium]
MRYLIIMFVSCIIVTSCSSTDSCLKDISRQNFSVSISKGMCFGMCPVYTGTVFGDQKIQYEGRMNVDRKGSYTGIVSKEELCSLITQVRQNKLLTLDTSYIDNVPDAPVTTMTITDMGRTRTFSWNMGSPEPFRELAALMVKYSLRVTSY